MNNDIYINRLRENRKLLNDYIDQYFQKENILDESMKYALAGGKMIRASLYLETRRIFSKDITKEDILYALAIEMIQAYTLVHDDLPSMDNDDFRRGRESVHRHFGEDIGILAGDGLLNEAARILFKLALKNPLYIKASSYLFDKLGKDGVIYGQVLDLRRRDSYDLDFLLKVYDKKTADFFKAALVSGGLVSGISEVKIKSLEKFAYYLGLGFQIQDDLLEEDYKDEINILRLMDKDEARLLLDDINKKCFNEIKGIENNDFYIFLIQYLTKRKY
ncbi:MAG: polyprenyl synthetase family protein [Anaerococcus sp.]|nr:polyprenyl synthetase family protein [Anaerococcus sp.]